ncbi:cytochrome c peroxidase [Thiohalorhabdus sp. Cl-TMA]|uniref:Cytochrome c peroxidase n=1 Tax=Thiohalorhabdus methylotrophus TaxID=3242694 RepID=A0ABV4TSV0_9GAMM
MAASPWRVLVGAFLTGCLLFPAWVAAGDSGAQIKPPAPGYTGLGFQPPAPGTYDLSVVKPAADGRVLQTNGVPARLHSLFGDEVVVFSFIYTHCRMTNGCPLASFVLSQTKRRLEETAPGLAEQVRLVSLSFDPDRDTPEVMREYGDRFREKGRGPVEWRFLTTEARAFLDPILGGYDQVAEKRYNEAGEWTGKFNHILRVFLIDKRQRIRNIYNVSFLHADILVNDILTLLEGEEDRSAAVDLGGTTSLEPRPLLASAGDAAASDGNRVVPPSRQPLAARILAKRPDREAAAQASDRQPPDTVKRLVRLVKDPPLGLPPVPVPETNPVTTAKVKLGRKLFFDRRLSLNHTTSCGMCHLPEQGFTNNELKTAVGFDGRSTKRNAPTILNVGYYQRFFHDARENRLENQIWGRLLARNEMNNASVGQVLEKIRRMPDYDGMFEAAFGTGPNLLNMGQAIASYERTLVSGNSPFDRWYYGDEEDALSEPAKRGFRLFTGKAGCAGCHRIGEEYALFTDQKVHSTGLGWYYSHRKEPASHQVTLAPGVTVETDSDTINKFGKAPPNDLGLYEVTRNPADRWHYRTPILRNVALTAPYMHNGAFESLEAVIRFYNKGGHEYELQDPRIRPLGLDDREVRDLVAFLKSLTGSNVAFLRRAAREAPIGDLGPEDPHWSHPNHIPYGRPGTPDAGDR